jgi:hypothetical protein
LLTCALEHRSQNQGQYCIREQSAHSLGEEATDIEAPIVELQDGEPAGPQDASDFRKRLTRAK